MQHPDATFVMPLHPLVKQAALSSDTKQRIITTLKTQTDVVPPGRYEFAIYQWQFHGIREDLQFKPIASSTALTPKLVHLLEQAVDASIDEQVDPGSLVWDELDTQHHKLWSEARVRHQQKTQELAAYRRESLSTSHQARITLLEEQLEQASNENIQRMRQSQIAAAHADYDRRIQELDSAIQKVDVIAEPVTYGILTIEKA